MWKLVYGSAAGTSHEQLGQPCQDAAFGSAFDAGGTNILIVASSDGAGSAQFSGEGSRLACSRMTQLISSDIEKGLGVDEFSRDHFIRWHGQLRGEIQNLAEARGAVPRDYACTLLTAIIADNGAAFSQIGDGAIVIVNGEEYRTAFWPQSGEYANTTNFITDEEFEQKLEFAADGAAIDGLAVFTDGLQMLALCYADKTVHSPFFRPLFKVLRDTENAEELIVPLCRFLSSKAVNDRTDDDKTLILAARC